MSLKQPKVKTGVKYRDIHQKIVININDYISIVDCVYLRTVPANTTVFCPVFDYAVKTDFSRGY